MHALFHIIHLACYILFVQAGFSANQKDKGRTVQHPGYSDCGMRLNWGISNFSWAALAV
jgi:hypothetical protein